MACKINLLPVSPSDELLRKNDHLGSQVEFLRLEVKQLTNLQETWALLRDSQRNGLGTGTVHSLSVVAGGGTCVPAELLRS